LPPDELVGSEPAEGLEPFGEILGSDEVAEVISQLVMAVVVVALNGRLLTVRFTRSTWPLVQG
jgi:hypothetical protein